MMIRLDRFLAEMGAGTRSQIREAAKKGRIQVNGSVEKRPDRKIDPETETVAFDGRPVAYVQFEYYMLNKPQGVVSATEDNLHQTAVELIGDRKRGDLFPVGRLDIDTEGLLLITNDGGLAHRLLSPKRHVDKRYFALIEGQLPPDAEERFAAGIELADGTTTLPAKLEAGTQMTLPANPGAGTETPPANPESGTRQTAGERRAVTLTIREGKFHQVKRMFEAVGCHVVYLKRISMGSLCLDGALEPGQYRPLTQAEIESLRAD